MISPVLFPFLFLLLHDLEKDTKKRAEETLVESFACQGCVGSPRARKIKVKKCGVTGRSPMRERERERERVANYLELPNNPTTKSRYFSRRTPQQIPYENPQKNLRFPAPRIHLYYIRKDAADSRCPLIRSLRDSYNRVQR